MYVRAKKKKTMERRVPSADKKSVYRYLTQEQSKGWGKKAERTLSICSKMSEGIELRSMNVLLSAEVLLLWTRKKVRPEIPTAGTKII